MRPMKASQTFISTLKEAPADAEVASHQLMLRAGLITAMVGLTLTIGLYPIGYFLPPFFASIIPFHLGPWLLPGLIPLGVGSALIISYYLERDNSLPEGESESEKEEEEPKTPKIRDITEGKRKKQRGE